MSDNEQKVIYPDKAPDYYNAWRFSPAIESQGFIFVSGCTGTLDNGEVPESVAAQARQAFYRIGLCLEAAGAGFGDVVEMTTYHVGLNSHLETFRSVKDEFIVAPFPAWTAIGVSELASKGAVVEIKVVAKRRSP